MEAYGDDRGFELAREREDSFEQSWQPKRNYMKPLNLTDEQRATAVVDYNVNKFELYIAGVFMSNYFTHTELRADLLLNQLSGAKFTRAAQNKYLS